MPQLGSLCSEGHCPLARCRIPTNNKSVLHTFRWNLMPAKNADLRTHVRLPKHLFEALRAHALSLGVSPTKAVEQIVLSHFTEGDAFRILEKRVASALTSTAEQLRTQQTEFIEVLADNLELLAE